jgi:hypothetical protein
MDHDQQTILSAYDEAVKKLYWTLLEQYAQAAGDPQQEQQSDQHFSAGVELARRSRDRALKLAA